MIKSDSKDLYSPRISKVCTMTRKAIVTSGGSDLIDSNGKKIIFQKVYTIYDRSKRNKNWFILDLRN